MTTPHIVTRQHVSVLQALVSASADHFYLYDRAGRHLYASPAVAQTLGIAQDDFIGKTWRELSFPPEVNERFDIERETVFSQGCHWQGELIFPTERGQPNTVGHHGGDLVLQRLAHRWSSLLRGSDTLSRVGGDEFVILLPGTDGRGAHETATRLRAEISQPFEIEGHRLRVGVSIGIVVHRGGRGDANALLREADAAMYQAKQQKGIHATPRD
jgi:PAS domain S-box-containing protein